MWLAGRYAVLFEDPVAQSPSGPYSRGTRIDIRDGSMTDLDPTTGVPAPGVPPTWSVSGGLLSYPIQRRNRNCVAVIRVATLRTALVDCAPREQYAGWPQVSEETLIYSQYSEAPVPGCRRLVAVPLSGGPAEPLPATVECAPFSGVRGPGFTVWGESPPDTELRDVAEMYGLEDGGEVVHLGQGTTNSQIVCAGWAYWVADSDLRKGDFTEIRRWRPGSHVEIVYLSPPGYPSTATPSCYDSLMTIQRSWTGGGEDHQQLVAATVPSD
jgi:hypothetical protein